MNTYYRTESIIIKDKNKISYLQNLLSLNTQLYNKITYHLRQYIIRQFKNNISIENIKFLKQSHIENLLKEDLSLKYNLEILAANSIQQLIRKCLTNFESYRKAIISYNKNKSKFLNKPKLPNYKKKNNQLSTIIIAGQTLCKGCKKDKLKDNQFFLPKSDFLIGSRIDRKYIKEVRILKIHQYIKIEIIYKKEINSQLKEFNECNSYFGIDLGVNNLASITSNDKYLSFIINGRVLKSINQFFNKRKSKLQSDLKLKHSKDWSKRLSILTYKRNNRINDYLHKASKKIIEMALSNGIDCLIIGKNDGWKQNINLSKKTNQSFTNIPHARFIELIKYKAEEVGMRVEIVEESYTSKIDHLSNENLCKQKIYSGKRIKRGLFKSASGRLINADIYGSIGILRKKKVISDIQLLNLGYRGDVVSPTIIKL